MNSEFDADSLGVLHAAASAISGMVEDHANSLPLNKGSFASWLRANEAFRRESKEGVEALA